MIKIAGDLKVTAYLDRAQVDRIVPFDKRAQMGMDRMFVDVNLDKVIKKESRFLLQERDKINVFSVLDIRQNIVLIDGAVTRPGSYDLGDSLRLRDLIRKADGLSGDAYLDRVDVIRTKPDYSEILIKLNLEKVMEGDIENNIFLEGLDIVKVYGTSDMVPKTYASISGHVKTPGRYVIQENMTLYDLLFKAGGYTDPEFKKATYLKRAELIRVKQNSDLKDIISFNLGRVLDKKDLYSEFLKPEDVVRVYSLKEIEGNVRYVTIEGHVKKPGRYELFEGNMRLSDLLFKSGGFSDFEFKKQTFLDRADLIRVNQDGITSVIIPFNLDEVLKGIDNSQNYKLESGDRIRVYSKSTFNSSRSVTISGSIRNPGNYVLKSNMTIKDLILEAGGVSEDVFRYKIEVSRIDPLSVNEDIFAEVFKLDMLNDYTISDKQGYFSEEEKDSKLDKTFQLRAYDNIAIRPDPYFRMQRKVEVVGSVYYPGLYTITNPQESIKDILERAGGMRPNAFAEGSTFIRNNQNMQIDLADVLKNSRSKMNIKVQDGDKIIIAKKPNAIAMIGEVNVPGVYTYVNKLRVKDMIDISGGLTLNASPSDIFIKYPNGISKKYNRFFKNHRVMDGSIITVGRKKEEEPFDRTEYAKELTSIFASLAQALSIIFLASK